MADNSESGHPSIESSINESSLMQDLLSIGSNTTLYEPNTKDVFPSKDSNEIVGDTHNDAKLFEGLGLSKFINQTHKLPIVLRSNFKEIRKSSDNSDPVLRLNYFELKEMELNIFGQPRLPLGPAISISSQSSEEEKENDYDESIDDQSAIDYKPEKKSEIDRKSYICEYITLNNEKRKLLMINSIFHRGLSEYFNKKKIERVYEESFINAHELTEKYYRYIYELYDTRANWFREKQVLENDIKDLTALKKENLEQFNKNFNYLIHREKEVGALLVDGNTGKKVSKEVYERLIHRQKQKAEEISEVRLIYMKKRDSIKDIEDKLKNIEIFDGNFHLIDYEQIQMEINTFRDKVEEREDDLRRLRERLAYAVQLVSHIREKLNVIIMEIEHKKTLVAERDQRIGELRERVNYLKTTRNSNRIKIKKLTINAGMLKYPKLLRDLDVAEEEKSNLATELVKIKKNTKENQAKLKAIRLVIEATEALDLRNFLEHGGFDGGYKKKYGI